jgi:poly(glycerol-phosphate) alpha-glucosyltransferase
VPTVAILTPSVSRAAGGVVDVVRRQSQLLQGLGGLSVTVLGLEDEHTAADLPAWLPVAPQVFPTLGPRAFRYSPGLARALSDLKPDLVHTHGLWVYPSRACHSWAQECRRPYLVTPHGMLDPWALRRSGWKKRLAAWLYENAHLRGAACLHALSTNEAQSFRRYGLKNPICVIPNGVDLPPDQAPSHPPSWDGLWESGCQVHLFLGRLNPKKGLLNLLAAWRDLREIGRAHV